MIRPPALGFALMACLAAVTPVAGRTGPKAHVIPIADFKFSPAELAVTRGDTLVWTNQDAFLHTTTADSGAWTSTELPRGGRFVHVASRVGRFSYHCAAHPVMRAAIVVRE